MADVNGTYSFLRSADTLYSPSTKSYSNRSNFTTDSAGFVQGQALVLGSPVHRDSVTIPKGRRVHADGTLEVAVPDSAALTDKTNEATAIVTQLGGYTQSSNYNDSRAGYGSAVLELRIPVGKAELAIQKLGALGRLVSQQVSTKDLQQQFGKQTNIIGRLRRAITVYNQALKSGTLSGSQYVNVQIQLANAKYELKTLLTSRSHTAASAATANIKLTLTTEKQQSVIVHPGKRGRLSRLLHNAGGFLGLEGVIVLYALIVAAPFVLLGALAWWVMRERRRREENLLAANA